MSEEETKIADAAVEPTVDTEPCVATETVSEFGMAGRVRELEAQCTAKDEALQDLDNQYRRLAADFDNFRRRQNMEKESLTKFAGERIIERFLDVMDNFERALVVGEKATEPQQVLTGISLIYKQLYEFLSKEGLAPMDAKGQPFDPNMHEAVVQEGADDVPDHTVLDEFRKGYLLNGRVLRHAMVKIADNPAIPAVPPSSNTSGPTGEAGEPAATDATP